MKNNIFISLFLILFSQSLKAENVLIESKKITLEKNAELSIFEENVVITTSENNIIKAEYAEYDKKNGVITLKNNVVATDNRNNKLFSNFASFFKLSKYLSNIPILEDFVISNIILNLFFKSKLQFAIFRF